MKGKYPPRKEKNMKHTKEQLEKLTKIAKQLKVSVKHYLAGKLDDRNKKWADAFQISSPESVALLPWAGNYGWDHYLFERVEHYVKKELTDKEQQKRALDLMAKHGMGIDSKCTDEQLETYLDDRF